MSQKTRILIASFLLILSACDPRPHPYVQPDPDLLTVVDDLPPPKATTMNELGAEDLALMHAYQVCKVRNDTKAAFIGMMNTGKQ